MHLMRSIKRSFWRGMAALLPALLTFIVLAFGISLVQNYLGRYVNWAIIQGVAAVSGIPLADVQAWYGRYFDWWVGVVVPIVGLCVIAYVVGTFIGGYLIRLVEGWIVRMPVLRKIYPGAKQVSEFFFGEKGVEFRRVVAIEYPRPGLWSMGFVTGRSFRAISDRAGCELLSVFVPTTPTPITGFVVSVPRDDVVDLPITVDEAFQYVISAGVVMPPAERIESLSVALEVTQDEARKTIRGASAETPPPPEEGQEPPDA